MDFNIRKIFTKEYWNLKNVMASPRRMFLVKQLRIFSLAVKGFTEDRVQIRASALTYYTMLSIVPIVAMAFAIAKGFGFEARLESIIKDSFSSQQEVASWILNFSAKYLENIKGGIIAGIGIVVLFWSIMRLLSNIELSFNDIWQIKKSRGMSRKMSDYISLVVIAPVLIIVSFGISLFLQEQENLSSTAFPLLEYVGPILSGILKILPFVFIWLVFMLLYIIMPNTKVKISSAIIGGIIAGTLFQVLNSTYINFQSQLTSYGAVYGSFAALPLFLIWLQLSWLIVLFGAEISFANQNVGHYEAESETLNVSNHMKRSVSLLIVHLIATSFKNGLPAMTAEEIADKLDLPVRLVRDILYELMEVGIASETVTQNVKENAYQPACDIKRLTTKYVSELLDKRGQDTIPTDNTKELGVMVKLIDDFNEAFENSPFNKLLVDIETGKMNPAIEEDLSVSKDSEK